MQTPNYQKLKIWQKSYNLTKLIYKVTKKFPNEERFGLTSQIRRATVSIVSNIAEGSNRRSRKDFLHFLNISQASLAEVQTQMSLSYDFGYIPEKEQYSFIAQEIHELSKMLSAFIKTTRNNLKL